MQIGFKSFAYPFSFYYVSCPSEMLLLNNNTMRCTCIELLLLSDTFAPFAFAIQHQFYSFASKMHSAVHIFSISIIHTVNVIEFIHTKCIRANLISIGMRTVGHTANTANTIFVSWATVTLEFLVFGHETVETGIPFGVEIKVNVRNLFD